MKKTVIIFVILTLNFALSTFNCFAQPNGGFENWSTVNGYQDPDGWQTLNFLSLLIPPNPLSAFKAIGIDIHSGNSALKLKTVFFNNKPQQVAIGDSAGGIYTGKITYSPPSNIQGFPYTDRPEKLEFWYKYIPVGNDIGKVSLILQKWNGTNHDTIASGTMAIPAAAAYTLFQMNLTYFSTAVPDTAAIGFSTSKEISTARLGSTLYIDDVLFTGLAGIIGSGMFGTDNVKIFPNPANDNITIQAQIQDVDNVKIVDVSGKLAGVYEIQNYNANINTSIYAEGIYLYEIYDKKNRILTTGKFNVVR